MNEHLRTNRLKLGGDTTLRDLSLLLADELSKGRKSLVVWMDNGDEWVVLELRPFDVCA